MKERMLKFIMMIIVVVAVGVAFTLFNFRLQDSAGRQEAVDFRREEAAAAGSGAPTLASADREAAGAEEAEEGAAVNGAAANGVLTDAAATEAAAAEAETTEERERTETEDSLSSSAQYAGQGEEAGTEADGEDSAATEAVQESSVYLEIVIESGPEEEAEDYYSRLSEMNDRLISNVNAAAEKTAADQQAAADAALTFWDDELNIIYQALRDRMPEDEFIVLRDEERAWIRQRDEAASQAAVSQNQSSSAQELAYTKSLLEWTRDRVYELAEMYYGE